MSHRTEASLIRAAHALGISARGFDVRQAVRFGEMGRRYLLHRLDAWQPDAILFTRHAVAVAAERWQPLLAGRQSAFWYFDAPERTELLDLARSCNNAFATSMAVRDWFHRNGAHAHFLPQGADPWLDDRVSASPDRYRCDLSFIGSGQYPHRWPLLAHLATRCTMQIRGPGWQRAPASLPVTGDRVRGREFAQVVHGAAVSLGANALPEQDGDRYSASNRMWKVMACGGAYLGARVPGIEALAAQSEHCRWYNDQDDAAEQLSELLSDPGERSAMAERGRRHVLAHHSYSERLSLLLDGRGLAVPETSR